MPRIDDATRLRHMRDATVEAMNFVEDHNRTDLDSDRMLTLALVKDIEIIGEAAGFLPLVRLDPLKCLGRR